MIAHLLSGQADIAMSPLIDVPARRNVVDFSFSLVYSTYTALYRLESYQGNRSGLLKPFQSSLWLLGSLFLVIAVSLMLYKSLKKPKCWYIVKQICSGRHREQSESWDLVHTIGILCARSLSLTFGSSLCEKTALLTVAMTGYLLNSLYTATVLTFLTSEPKTIDCLDQLLSTSFTFGFANFYPMVQSFKAKKYKSKTVLVFQSVPYKNFCNSVINRLIPFQAFKQPTTAVRFNIMEWKIQNQSCYGARMHSLVVDGTYMWRYGVTFPRLKDVFWGKWRLDCRDTLQVPYEKRHHIKPLSTTSKTG